MALYVCNASFGPYAEGEYVKAEPALVSDWVEAQLLSEVDAEGDRLFDAPAAPPAEQPITFAPTE